MNSRKKIIYGLVTTIIVSLFGFCTYSVKDLVVYAGQRDKDLARNEEKVSILEKDKELTTKERKEFQKKQNKINNEIDKKLSSIQTILKALADKEGIRYD